MNSYELFNKAQEAQIARNDLVVQAAKIVDPGAFAVAYGSTAPDAKLLPPSARQRYLQAEALFKAEKILRLAVSVANLRQVLTDSEVAGWRDLGVPIDDSTLREIVEVKYRE